MWVGGCVTAPTAWASQPGRRRRSVHKSVEMASRGRFGAFVYTVAPWAWVVGGLGIAIVYTNGRIGLLRAGLGRLCTLLRCCERPWGRRSVHKSVEMAPRRRFGAFVYTVATRVAIRIATRAACVRWHERLSRYGVPAAPPRWPLSLGREDRLCASGAAVRLASSPRQQPTQIPDEPGSSGLYEGREGRPPREGPVTLDWLTRWPRHLGSVQSKGVIGPIVEWNPGDGLRGRADSR